MFAKRVWKWWWLVVCTVMGGVSLVLAGICPIPCRSVADSAIGRYFQAFMSSVIDPILRDLEERFEVLKKLRGMPGVFSREASDVRAVLESYDRRELPSYRVGNVRSAREASVSQAEAAGEAALEAVAAIEDRLRDFSPSRFDLTSSVFQVQKDAAKLAFVDVQLRTLLLEQMALREMAEVAKGVKEEVKR
ncbi:MAG: hypothetical protein QW650_01055 [Thermofilum sp.]